MVELGLAMPQGVSLEKGHFTQCHPHRGLTIREEHTCPEPHSTSMSRAGIRSGDACSAHACPDRVLHPRLAQAPVHYVLTSSSS